MGTERNTRALSDVVPIRSFLRSSCESRRRRGGSPYSRTGVVLRSGHLVKFPHSQQLLPVTKRWIACGWTEKQKCTFRFRFIFFCSAAARTALPFTMSLLGKEMGLVGREAGPVTEWLNFFGVVTPVFWPVAVPSRRGNCTFRVSK